MRYTNSLFTLTFDIDLSAESSEFEKHRTNVS